MAIISGKLIYSIDGVMKCDYVGNRPGFTLHEMIKHAKNKYYNNNIIIYKYIQNFRNTKYTSEIINKNKMTISNNDDSSDISGYHLDGLENVEFWVI